MIYFKSCFSTSVHVHSRFPVLLSTPTHTFPSQYCQLNLKSKVSPVVHAVQWSSPPIPTFISGGLGVRAFAPSWNWFKPPPRFWHYRYSPPPEQNPEINPEYSPLIIDGPLPPMWYIYNLLSTLVHFTYLSTPTSFLNAWSCFFRWIGHIKFLYSNRTWVQ